MKIDFTQRLKALDGSELIEDKKPITLAIVSVNALLMVHADENASGETKAQRWKLAQTIFAADAPIDIGVEDVVQIKKLVGTAFAPLVVGQAFAMLDS